MILPRPQKETYQEGSFKFPKTITVTTADDSISVSDGYGRFAALYYYRMFIPDSAK